MNKEQAIIDFERDIESLIIRRRRQILVHSCIYYRFNTSIIDDQTFDTWARELVNLHNTYPDIANRCKYTEAFYGFDGTTGYDLPTYEDWIMDMAKHLIDLHRRLTA